MLVERNMSSDPSKMSRISISRATLKPPEIVRMKALARLHVWWPSLDTDIEQLVRSCESNLSW